MNQLTPIASVKNRRQYESLLESDSIHSIKKLEKKLLEQAEDETFEVKGFCLPCNKEVSFLVDIKWGGQRFEGGWIPNWRERLECPICGMNNRQRLIASLVKQQLTGYQHKQVYFMEQVTPIFKWASETFTENNILGSEYLGFEYSSGVTINGIRHEDVENLSFSSNALDLIISNDVFEHVPHPNKAFAECARVLKPEGIMLATMPFHSDKDDSITRAIITNGNLEHLSPPAYHGNPISEEGSLVFTDFGWDVLEEIQKAGFKQINLDIYASAEFGHLGNGQVIFKFTK